MTLGCPDCAKAGASCSDFDRRQPAVEEQDYHSDRIVLGLVVDTCSHVEVGEVARIQEVVHNA